MMKQKLDWNPTEPRSRIAALPMRHSRKGKAELLLVSSDRHGWTVPKGEIMPDERLKRALSRLVFEQAGAVGTVDLNPVGSFLDMSCSKQGRLQPQRFWLYPFTVSGTLVSWKERGNRTRRWIPAGELINWVSEPGLSMLIRNWMTASTAVVQRQHAEPEDPRQWAEPSA